MSSPEFDPRQAECVGYRSEGEVWCVACSPTNDTEAAIWNDDKSPLPLVCYSCGEPVLPATTPN